MNEVGACLGGAWRTERRKASGIPGRSENSHVVPHPLLFPFKRVWRVRANAVPPSRLPVLRGSSLRGGFVRPGWVG